MKWTHLKRISNFFSLLFHKCMDYLSDDCMYIYCETIICEKLNKISLYVVIKEMIWNPVSLHLCIEYLFSNLV